MKKKFLIGVIAALTLAGCGEGGSTNYTITWKNEDGTVLEVDTDVKENEVPTYDSANPTKQGNAQYSYVFNGWTPEVVAATGDATYTATYEQKVNSYTITWKDYDGSTLDTQTYEYGATPEYSGTPYREDDENYSYIFSSWSPAITTVTGNATYTATYTQTSKVEDLGVKTISQVRELCQQLTGLNSAGIAVDMTRKVTIKGLALAKFSTVKTTKKFDLNLSMPNKTIFGDSTGYIGCASGVGDNTLWGKVADYAGKEGSTYEITGYLSMYLGQPELYVPGKTYTYDPSLGITFDAVKNSKSVETISSLYEKASTMMYNCAGHAYGDVYTIKNLYVTEKRDDSFIATDGIKTIKLTGTKAVSVGNSYDITGFVCLTDYVPYLHVYSANNGVKTEFSYDSSKFETKSITEFRKLKTSQDDTSYKYPDYIKNWGSLYTAEVYASYYTVNGKYYVTVSDAYYKSDLELSNRATAQITWNMVDICNDNYWNVSWEQLERYCPIGYYVNEEESFDFYYTTFQEEYSSGKPLWKVFTFNSLNEVPEVE